MTISRRQLARFGMLAAASPLLGELTAGGAQAATLAEIKSKGTMVVATEDNFRPFEYIENGQPKGLDHALLALLRKEAPFRIQQQIIPWTGLLPGVTSGKYDAAVTAAVITPERVRNLDFTMPIAEDTQYYAVRVNETGIKTVADLSGKTVGVQAGGASYEALGALRALLAKTGGKLGLVKQYTSFPEAYQDLAEGRIDYVVNGVVNLTSLVRDHPDRFRLGQAVAPTAYVAWAVAKGNTSLLDYLDNFLASVRKNGQLYQLQTKWLGTTFEDMPDTPTVK